MRWICAEAGLGPALIHYFVRSGVKAEAGVAEWPPESGFDDAPVQRYLFRVPEVPARMAPLLTSTPGLGVYVPASPGAAVESGFRHPVNLRACPVFPEGGLVLFRGGGRDPLELPKLPVLGDVGAFARVELRKEALTAKSAEQPIAPELVKLPLRLIPSTEPWRAVTATWIRKEDIPILRHIAYALGPDTLRRARIACTQHGVFLKQPGGIEGIPVGEFFREVHPGLFVPAGYDPVPAVAPDVLYKALGAPSGQTLFVARDGKTIGVPNSGFVPLESALLEAQEWAPITAAELSTGASVALAEALPEVSLRDVGIRPLRDVAPIPPGAAPDDGRGA